MRHLLFLLLLVVSLRADPAPAAPDLDVSGLEDDSVAAARIVAWCRQLGIEARLGEKSGKSLALTAEKLSVAPKVTLDSVDRLVIYNFYEGRPGNRENAALRLLVAKVNAQYNVCSLFVDAEGDLCFQYNLSFDDRLSARLFRRQLLHANETAREILRRHEEDFLPYLAK